MCGFYVNVAWMGQQEANITVFSFLISSPGPSCVPFFLSKLCPLYLRLLLQTSWLNLRLTLPSLYTLETQRRNQERFIYISSEAGSTDPLKQVQSWTVEGQGFFFSFFLSFSQEVQYKPFGICGSWKLVLKIVVDELNWWPGLDECVGLWTVEDVLTPNQK